MPFKIYFDYSFIKNHLIRWLCIYIYIYIYIYILYIYIYILLSKDRLFFVSQLFSVARHAGCFKLGSKPTQLYVRFSILPLSHRQFYIFALPDTGVLYLLEKLCIMWVAAVNYFARELMTTLFIYRYRHYAIYL